MRGVSDGSHHVNLLLCLLNSDKIGGVTRYFFNSSTVV